MADKQLPMVSGEVLEEEVELTFSDFRRICRLTVKEVHILVEEGIVEPSGGDGEEWRFDGASVPRARRALQLHRDLGVNWAGAALALELLDELREVRARLQRLEENL